MPRDLHNNIKVSRGVSPATAVTANTPFVSQILDTANFDSNEFVWCAGAIDDVDVTFTTLVEEGNDPALSDAAAVVDNDLLGTESGANPLLSSDNRVGKIGYKGSKRYIRATITPANNTGNIFLAGVWIQGSPRTLPQNTQIV